MYIIIILMKEYASDAWNQAYVDTNKFIMEMNEDLSEFLSNVDY